MARLILEDDCLAPDTQIVLRYEGPDPFRAYQRLNRLMRDIWEVEAIAYWEREFRWDNSGDPHEFVVKSYVDRGIDAFTRARIEVFMQGWQPSDPTKPGRLEIRMGGVLVSTFGGGNIFNDARNPLFKVFMEFYIKYFYQKQRQYYLKEWCYNRLQRLKRAYQEILNITPVERETVT